MHCYTCSCSCWLQFNVFCSIVNFSYCVKLVDAKPQPTIWSRVNARPLQPYFTKLLDKIIFTMFDLSSNSSQKANTSTIVPCLIVAGKRNIWWWGVCLIIILVSVLFTVPLLPQLNAVLLMKYFKNLHTRSRYIAYGEVTADHVPFWHPFSCTSNPP